MNTTLDTAIQKHIGLMRPDIKKGPSKRAERNEKVSQFLADQEAEHSRDSQTIAIAKAHLHSFKADLKRFEDSLADRHIGLAKAHLELSQRNFDAIKRCLP